MRLTWAINKSILDLDVNVMFPRRPVLHETFESVARGAQTQFVTWRLEVTEYVADDVVVQLAQIHGC